MENQTIDWKRQWDDEFLKWLCAFANTKGGVLEIGKDDKGNVVGLSNPKKLMEDLPNKIRQALGIVAAVELREENGLPYIRISVNAYGQPIICRGKYYYRSGSTTQELSGTALDDFLLRLQGKTWDSFLLPDVTMADLQADAIKLFRKKALSSRRLSVEDLEITDTELLDSLLLFEKSTLNRAGVLLFHENPEKWVVLGSYVKIAYITDDIMYHDEVRGAIITLPDRIMDLVYTKYFKPKITYEGIQRVETFPVPRSAFREAVINAIIHKDYTSNNPIQIRIYDDKVEIDNEGRLPDDWTIEDLKGKHKSKPRNPLLATAFFRSGMIEAWGRGIERINNALRAEDKPDIDYRYNGSDIVAVFNTSVQTNCTDNYTEKTLNDTEKAMLELMRRNSKITTTQIAESLKVVRGTINNAIKRLKELGIIKRQGSDRAGYWEIIK